MNLSDKTLLPTDLRTRELSRLPAWVREQSFFMAGVVRASTLEYFRTAAAAVQRGELSETEALRIIREGLAKEKYQAAPGQEGTIKDLSTVRRQRTTLGKAVAFARGYAAEETAQAMALANPAKELYRAAAAQAPRLWTEKLWPAAVTARNAAHPDLPPLHAETMIAPLNDPVWLLISDFGYPYPPFKWGSKMAVKPVGFRRALALGFPRALPRTLRSPGENMEAVMDSLTPEAERAILGELRGLAEVVRDKQGVRVLFTDPNGTRPYTPERLAPLIAMPNVDGSTNYQLAALQEWHRLGGDAEAAAAMRRIHAGTDMLDDFNRLTARMLAAGAADAVTALARLALLLAL